MSDGLRDDIVNEFTRWRGWPKVGKGMTTHWLDTDAMVAEIQALRQEVTILRKENALLCHNLLNEEAGQ